MGETHFTWIDWLVVAGYLIFTTWFGHAMRGQQSTIKDFFLAGRRLPWPAVCGSMIATELSALTFIGVPGMVYAAGGDFTYLQWGLGSLIARVIVAWVFIPRFYAEEIYSPYDYMGNQLGPHFRTLTTILFSLGSILGQSVRVLVTAVILQAVAGFDLTFSIFIISIFAITWTWMGGMTTVIWTDVLQFGLFIFGGVLALVWIASELPGGFSEILISASASEKLTVFNYTSPFEDPTIQFTLWVGLIAMPFQNLAAFGTDQLNAQRMFCCKNIHEARLAMIFSSGSLLITALLLFTGAGLFAWYEAFPLTSDQQTYFAANKDHIFPYWICSVLPVGLAGLVIAGAFAAAISSLDSILTALSQTTLSLIVGKKNLDEEDSDKLLFQSRVLVGVWGIILCGVALGLDAIKGQVDLISLAFGMLSYTSGPILGIFLLAISGAQPRLWTVVTGVVISFLLVMWIRPDVANLMNVMGFEETSAWLKSIQPKIAFPWLYPVTFLIVVGFGAIEDSRNHS